MSSDIRLHFRRLSEVNPPSGLSDRFGIYGDATFKRDILAHNPYKLDSDDVFQIIAACDSTMVGAGIMFPTKVKACQKTYSTVVGHSLFVAEEYRCKGIGSRITDRRLEFSESKSLLICEASQMNIPILKRLGAHIFYLPRMILLQDSFSVVEQKAGKLAAKLLSPVANIILRLQRALMQRKRKRILSRGLTLKEFDEIPYDVERILAADKHPFQEVHGREWFQWVKDNSLASPNDKAVKKFVMIYNGDEPVGFYMTRQRFYAKASHRGFRNITLGTVLEWQTADEGVLEMNEAALLATTSFGTDVDAVELCCDNARMVRYFKRKGLVQVGAGNIVFRYRPTSTFASIKEIGDASKWRLRPSMGDNALS